MSDPALVNFTYKTPADDFFKGAGINPGGLINIPFSLMKMRNLMQHNLNIINKLLANANHIKDIGANDNDNMYIIMDSNEAAEELIKEKVLTKNINYDDDDSDSYIPIDDTNTDIPPELLNEEEPETNASRFAMINNLINQDNAQMIYGKIDNDDEEDTDALGSDKETFIDDANIQIILDKYKKVMKISKADTDSDSYSESDSDSYDNDV